MLKGKGIISNIQREILISVSSIEGSQYFYFTGGTALSEFYFGHRLSYDLDFFTTEKEIILPFWQEMEVVLSKDKFLLQVIRKFQAFVEAEAIKENDRTKIHLACDSPFKLHEPVDSEFKIKVNSYQDMVVDKLLTFFGRAEPRDAIDLFFILKKENFEELIKLASKKDPCFDIYWLAVAMEKVRNFPDEIEKWPVDMLVNVNVKELKDIFSNYAKEIIDKIRGLR